MSGPIACPACRGKGKITRDVSRRSRMGEWDEDVEVTRDCEECDGGGAVLCDVCHEFAAMTSLYDEWFCDACYDHEVSRRADREHDENKERAA